MSKAKQVIATLALVVMGPLCVVNGAKELSNSRKLVARGQKTEAEVVDAHTSRRKSTTSYHLTIAFQATGGQSVRRGLKVNKTDYETGQSTHKVPVYYLQEDPEICAVGETMETRFGTLLGGIAMLGGGVFLGLTLRR
jgi:hypothetical protein